MSNDLSAQNNQTPNSSRLLLAELRGGDYAHPGDEEAIDMVITQLLTLNSNIKSGKMVDVGSGFGGTLNYLQQKGFQNLEGVDIDKAAVQYAKEKYPSISFHNVDALKITSVIPENNLSLISLFSVLYAIKDKKQLLSELNKIAKPGAILLLFDYSLPMPSSQTTTTPLAIKDLSGKEIYPIQLNTISKDLKDTGWEIKEQKDLSENYKTWYKTLLSKLQSHKKELKLKFSEEDINKVEATFSYLLSQLEQGHLGGVVIYAYKKE